MSSLSGSKVYRFPTHYSFWSTE